MSERRPTSEELVNHSGLKAAYMYLGHTIIERLLEEPELQKRLKKGIK